MNAINDIEAYPDTWVKKLLDKNAPKDADTIFQTIKGPLLGKVFDATWAADFKSLEMLWVFVKNGYNIGQEFQKDYSPNASTTAFYQNLVYDNNPKLLGEIRHAALSIKPYPLEKKDNLPLQETLSSEHLTATKALIHLGAPIHTINTKVSTSAYQILWIKATEFERRLGSGPQPRAMENENSLLNLEREERADKYISVFEYFKSHGQDLQEKIHGFYPPLFDLLNDGDMKMWLAQYLIAEGANPHERVDAKLFNDGEPGYETSFTQAVSRGYSDYVEFCLNRASTLQELESIKADVEQCYRVNKKAKAEYIDFYRSVLEKNMLSYTIGVESQINSLDKERSSFKI